MARAAWPIPSGPALAASPASRLVNLDGIERLADHPGRGDIHVGFEAIGGGGGGFRRELHRVPPTLAGEGIGVAGIDHERSCHPVLKPGSAPLDRGRRGLRPGEHAGDRGAGIEQREQQIGAAGIADARRASCEAHPVNGGEMRQHFRCEWRDLAHLKARGPRI